jgi:hypothetical protein
LQVEAAALRAWARQGGIGEQARCVPAGKEIAIPLSEIGIAATVPVLVALGGTHAFGAQMDRIDVSTDRCPCHHSWGAAPRVSTESFLGKSPSNAILINKKIALTLFESAFTRRFLCPFF